MHTDCIFCKIVAGVIPAHKVYEDESYLAFLDINPRAPGHILVIPKEHMRYVWDSTDIGEYYTVVQKLAHALKRAYNHDLIRSQVYGNEVPHAHVWLWPDVALDGTEKDFALHAEKIKSAL